MICLIEMACWWFWAQPRPGLVRQLVAFGAMAAAMLVLLATGSRSGLLGLGVLGVLLQTRPATVPRAARAQVGGCSASGRVRDHRRSCRPRAWQRMSTSSRERADRRDVERDARGDARARLADRAGLSGVRGRARQLPRGLAAGLQGRLLPAAAQLVSLGAVARAASSCSSPTWLSLLGDVARPAGRSRGSRIAIPRSSVWAARAPRGVPPVLLLLRVRRSVAEPDHLRAARARDHRMRQLRRDAAGAAPCRLAPRADARRRRLAAA